MKRLRPYLSLLSIFGVLLCTEQTDFISGRNGAQPTCTVAPKILFTNATTANQLPGGLDSVEVHLISGAWDTTVREAFSKRRLTIDRVPVERDAEATLSCLDRQGDTVYQARNQLQLVANQTSTPELRLEPVESGGFVLFILSPVSGDSTNAASITVSGYCDPGDAGLQQLYVNQQPVSLNGTSFSTRVDLMELGANTIPIYALDNKGNMHSKPALVIIRDPKAQDNLPPEITLSQPLIVNDTASVSVSNPTIAGMVNDPSGILTLLINQSSAASAVGAFSFIQQIDTTRVNRIILSAIDKANPPNVKNDTFYIKYIANLVDNIPPAISITSPTNNLEIGSTQTQVQGSATDGQSAIDSITIKVNGDLVTTVRSSSTFNLTVSLREGKDTIAVTAYDTKGNHATSTIYVICNPNVVDTTKPTISILSPSNGDTVRSASTSVTVEASDRGKGIRNVVFTKLSDDSVITVSSSTGTIYSAVFSLSRLGKDTIVVTAYDNATPGNFESDTVIFVRAESVNDRSGPSISYDNSKFYDFAVFTQSQIVLTGSVADESGVGGLWVDNVEATPAGGSWSNASDWSIPVTLKQGDNLLLIMAKDQSASSNVSYDTLLLKYEKPVVNTKPTIPVVVAPQDGEVDVPQLPTLKWNCSDPDGQIPAYIILIDTFDTPTTRRNIAMLSNAQFQPLNLQGGKTYFWQVLATDGIDTVKSPVWKFTVRPTIRPAVVLDPATVVTDVSVELTWSKITDGAFSSYQVYKKWYDPISGGMVEKVVKEISDAFVTRHTVTGLVPSTEYWFSITTSYALNTEFARSNELKVTTLSRGSKPTVPSVLLPADQATEVPTDASLSWECSDADGMPLFDVFLGLNNPPTTRLGQALNTLSATTGMLRFDTPYYWQVVAYQGGDTVAGPVWSFTTEKYALQAQWVDTTATSITIQWNGAPAANFVRYDIVVGGSKVATYPVANWATTSFTLDTLIPISSYAIRVVAVFANDVTVESNTIDAATRRPGWTALPGMDQLVYYQMAPEYPPSLSLALGPNGELFIAYPEGRDGTYGRPSVRKFNGTGWSVVGTTAFGTANGYFANLAAAPNGELFLAHSGSSTTGQPPLVSRFSGTSWQSLSMGSIPSTAFVRMASPQDHIPLVVNPSTNQPTLCTNEQLLRRFSGSSWIGKGDLVSGAIPAGCTGIDMAINKDNTEYVCYVEPTTGCHVQYTLPGDPTYVYDLVDGATDFDDMDLSRPCLDIECDRFGGMYVAYRTAAAYGSVCRVKQYTAGDFILLGTQVTDWPADHIALAVEQSAGTPYVAFVDQNGRCVVRKLSGTSWVDVGNPEELPAGVVSNLQLKVSQKAGEMHPTVYLACLSGSGAYQIKAFRILDM